ETMTPTTESRRSVLAHRRIGPAAPASRSRPRGNGRVMSGIDFTSLRETAEELIELEGELDAIFHAFPDVFFWVDAGGVVLASKAGRPAAAPFTEEQVVGRPISDVFPADFVPALERAFRDVLKTRAPVAVERAIVVGEDPHDYEARLLPLAKAPG